MRSHPFRWITRPSITDERELTVYILSVSSFCVGAALVVDVINQLIFFQNWATALRSWAITVVLCAVIAAPILRAIGKANLELYRAHRAVELLSRIDSLTNLPNRRALMEVAETAPAAAMVLVIVDIDRFKRVNDTYGHRGGDAVLQAVAEAMREDLGSLGCVGRLGGEEFALISASADPAPLIARLVTFRDRMAALRLMFGGEAVSITISAGAAIRGASQSFDDLYASADEALYEAKRRGRNRIRLSPELSALCGMAEEPVARDVA